MSSTRVRQYVKAPWERVYRALLDARAVEKWMVPAGMLPAGLSAADNEAGWRISLAKLAALVEAG